MNVTNFQRVGAVSNAHAGRDFENDVRSYWLESTGVQLQKNFPVQIGYTKKRVHKLDLGGDDPPILIECKSYTWTTGGNSPSAKIRSINEVMLLFSLAPPHYRKLLFLLKHMRGETSLASHYVQSQGHLIGPGIEIWELDPETRNGVPIYL